MNINSRNLYYDQQTPLVTVCLITYNHEKYIEDAINGVLMQEVDFSFKLLIADDFSTDGTRDILLKYQNDYPDIIELILQENNVGPGKNWLDLITAPKSKYIAYFEGDDYWTDSLKLNKQIRFLEENPNYSFTFHNVKVIYDGINASPKIYHPVFLKKDLEIMDLIKGVRIPSVSIVYCRNKFWIPDWILSVYNGDYAMELLLATKGSVKYFDEIMGVYRMHSNGMNSTNKNSYVHQQIVVTLSYFNFHTKFIYDNLVKNKISELFEQYKYSEIADLPKYKRVFKLLLWKAKINELKNKIKYFNLNGDCQN
jgi:glycosyltransferase involved in cell wall biosynthesis